jgi:hypothetical protein
MATTANMSLESALSLNNDAVALLVAGQDRKALAQLQQSVALVKRIIARHLHSRGRSSPKGVIDLDTSSSPLRVSLMKHLHQDSVQLSGLTNLQCYVYNRAFRISSEELLQEDLEGAAQIGSAIIIFNMALVLHRACLLKNRLVPSAKSMALYKIVLQLLKQSPIEGITGAIKLAAANNMAQLQFEEGDYGDATQGFARLASLMTSLQGEAPLGASEMRGIVINILCLKKGAKFAPAA